MEVKDTETTRDVSYLHLPGAFTISGATWKQVLGGVELVDVCHVDGLNCIRHDSSVSCFRRTVTDCVTVGPLPIESSTLGALK